MILTCNAGPLQRFTRTLNSLIERGEVPVTIEELMALPSLARAQSVPRHDEGRIQVTLFPSDEFRAFISAKITEFEKAAMES